MEPELKVFLLLGFIGTGMINIVSYIFLILNGFGVFSVFAFILSTIGLIYIILKIAVFERNNKVEQLEIIKNSSSTIFRYQYEKPEWDKLALVLFKKEVYDFYKFFIPIVFLLILFLILISGDGVFYLFFYLFILILPPIFIINFLKFKKNKDVYFNIKMPSVLINRSGVLINNEIGHYFGYEVYDAKIVCLKEVEFIEIFTFNPRHRGGGYRSIFVPVPKNYNIKGVLLKLKDLKWR